VSTSKKVKGTSEGRQVLLDAMTQGNAPLSVALADKNILHFSDTMSDAAVSLRTSAEQRIQISESVAVLARKAPEVGEWTCEQVQKWLGAS